MRSPNTPLTPTTTTSPVADDVDERRLHPRRPGAARSAASARSSVRKTVRSRSHVSSRIATNSGSRWPSTGRPERLDRLGIRVARPRPHEHAVAERWHRAGRYRSPSRRAFAPHTEGATRQFVSSSNLPRKRSPTGPISRQERPSSSSSTVSGWCRPPAQSVRRARASRSEQRRDRLRRRCTSWSPPGGRARRPCRRTATRHRPDRSRGRSRQVVPGRSTAPLSPSTPARRRHTSRSRQNGKPASSNASARTTAASRSSPGRIPIWACTQAVPGGRQRRVGTGEALDPAGVVEVGRR